MVQAESSNKGMTMSPPSRRILPSQALASFGAIPLYCPPPTTSAAASTTATTARARRAPQPPSTDSATATTTTERDDESTPPIAPVGIRIAGWDIVTRNSAIGDEGGMEGLTSFLEGVANDDDDGGGGSDGRRRRRRLCPPEIAFLDAVVSFRYRPRSAGGGRVERRRGPSIAEEEEGGGEDDDDDEGDSFARGMRLDARGALSEWAEAHRYLEMPQQHPSTEPLAGGNRRGVSIVRTADAALWSSRSRGDYDDPASATATATTTATSGESQFYYDWTYSSPYAGTVVTADGEEETSDDATMINNRQMWMPLSRSHIPLRLLRDDTQPILLYDDVHLYEDDLHDNGDVELNAKIRVMPGCWYVLQRLFVRVDRVCVRCREVRYFCSFEDVRDDDGERGVVVARANVIYRDVSWREAAWEELRDAGMPTDPAAWREGGSAGGGVPGMPAPPPLASLLMRLPSVSLPDDIPRFSCFDASQRMKD